MVEALPTVDVYPLTRRDHLENLQIVDTVPVPAVGGTYSNNCSILPVIGSDGLGDLPSVDLVPAIHSCDVRNLPPVPAVGGTYSNNCSILPVIGSDGLGDLPSVDLVPAIHSCDVRNLPLVDSVLAMDSDYPEELPTVDIIPAIDKGDVRNLLNLPIVGNSPGSCSLPTLDMHDSVASGLPAVGGCTDTDLPGLHEEHSVLPSVAQGDGENGDVPPSMVGAREDDSAVGTKSMKRKHRHKAADEDNHGMKERAKRKHRRKAADEDKHGMKERLASGDLPWRQLPYLRAGASGDIVAIAERYGSDLLGEGPDAQWLDVVEAHRLLTSLNTSCWRYSLHQQGGLRELPLGSTVDFMEIFSGNGNLSLAAAVEGMKVGPGIDIHHGKAHANSFTLDLRKASDRRIVWALVSVLKPKWVHMGFPCTFWIAMAHWTRRRDLDRNEQSRYEALVFVFFSRQVVYYQASRWRHSSIENPPLSVAWDLDIVKDMIGRAGMMSVDTHGCAWGAKDPVSGRYYAKVMRFACTFTLQPLARKCPGNHQHEVVKGRISQGHFKGRLRSAVSGEYPMAFCEAWVSLAKRHIIGTS